MENAPTDDGAGEQEDGSALVAAEPAAPALYEAPPITPPSPEELRSHDPSPNDVRHCATHCRTHLCRVAEARKLILRALDTKITQQDARTALDALELARRPGWHSVCSAGWPSPVLPLGAALGLSAALPRAGGQAGLEHPESTG